MTIKKRAVLSGFIFACAGYAWLSPMMPARAGTASASAASLPATEKFSSASAAAEHCPGDKIVWAGSSKSKAFHLSDSKFYGKTRHGAFVCEKDALAAGLHPSKR